MDLYQTHKTPLVKALQYTGHNDREVKDFTGLPLIAVYKNGVQQRLIELTEGTPWIYVNQWAVELPHGKGFAVLEDTEFKLLYIPVQNVEATQTYGGQHTLEVPRSTIQDMAVERLLGIIEHLTSILSKVTGEDVSGMLDLDTFIASCRSKMNNPTP